MSNVFIDISPSKERKVCQNCKYFSKWGVHLGTCCRIGARITDRLDSEKCKYFFKEEDNDNIN